MPVQSQHTEDPRKGILWRVLDRLEDCLIKMIIGIFKFAFWRIPKFIWDTIESWFLTVVKLINVFLLLILWLLIILGQLLYLYNKLYGITPHRIDIEIELKQLVINYGPWSLAWTAIALMGSFWGILYVQRRTWQWWQRRKTKETIQNNT